VSQDAAGGAGGEKNGSLRKAPYSPFALFAIYGGVDNRRLRLRLVGKKAD